MYAKSIKKKQSEAHHWSCYCSHEVTTLKTSQPVTWCSFRSLPPPIMWIQRPSRSQSCLSQSGYNNLWQCIYLSVCDKWYLIFQLYANVWSQGYSFLTVHLYFEALQSSSFAWSCMKRHALKNWGRDMMHLQYITFVIHIDDYRCIQLGSSCWPLALNNLEPVPYNMQPQLNEELLFDSGRYKYVLCDVFIVWSSELGETIRKIRPRENSFRSGHVAKL